MTNFQSCHLTAHGKLTNDHGHVRNFIDAIFFIGEVFLPYFLNRLHPQMLTLFLTISLILGKWYILLPPMIPTLL